MARATENATATRKSPTTSKGPLSFWRCLVKKDMMSMATEKGKIFKKVFFTSFISFACILSLIFGFAINFSHAGNLGLYPKFKAFDSNGALLSGGKLYTYTSGTTTPKAVYTDAALTTPADNPVVLDANGEATIYLSGTYKFILKTSADVTVWTQDAVDTSGLAAASNSEAVAKTSTSVALTPGNVASLMASPGAIGGTAASTGKFTTVTVSTGAGAGKALTSTDSTGLATWSDVPKHNLLPNSRYSVCSGCSSTSTGSNLVTNGELWTGATGATPPTGWTVGAQGTYAITAGGGGYSGEGLEVTYNSASPGVYQDITTTVGHTYLVLGYFKKGTANALVKVGKTDDDDYYYTASEATASYVAFSHTFEAAASTTRITLYHAGSAGQTAYFDSVVVYESLAAVTADTAVAIDQWQKDADIDFYRFPYWYASLPEAIDDGHFYVAGLINNSAVTDEAMEWPNSTRRALAQQYKLFAGRQVTLGCGVLATEASKARLCITTSAGSTCSGYHTGGDTWEHLEVTVSVPSTITSFYIELRPGTSHTAYFKPAMLTFGSAVGEGGYAPIPQEIIYLDVPITDQFTFLGKTFSDVDWTTLTVATSSAGRLPRNLMGALINTSVFDSGIASARAYFATRKDSSTTYHAYANDIGGRVNSTYASVSGWTPCDVNGDFQYKIDATGSSTFAVEELSYVAVQLW